MSSPDSPQITPFIEEIPSSNTTTTDNRNGILNPLETDRSSNSQSGRIWFSAVMLDDSSTTPVTAPGDATSPQQETSIPDGWNQSSQRRRVRGRMNRLWGMQGQWKNLKSQHGQWTCFLCCHVRTGTIVIGFWHMLLHLMSLSLIAVVMTCPEILNKVNKEGFQGEHLEVSHGGVQDVQAVNCSEMPCLLATQGNGRLRDATSDFPLSLGNLLSTHRLNAEDVNVALFITLCTFIVTLLLVYGAFREQPSHLMPFFFLQVFDFCISSMTMFGYLSYLPNVRQVISESPIVPFQHLQHQLLAMNPKCLTFFVMLIFISTFMVKAYCISIVWRCYKFLMQRSQGGRWHPRSRMGHAGPVDQESQTLVMGHDLPDYDTAITDPQYRKKVSGLYPEPPPSYDMAMAAYYAQQQIISEAQSGTGTIAAAAAAAVGGGDNAPLLGSSTTTAEVNDSAAAAAVSGEERGVEAGPSTCPATN